MIIQIAGVHDQAEAEDIIAAGATHLGLPLRLPDGREDLDETSARALVCEVRERIQTVLITYQTNANDIAEFAAWLGVDGVQLHAPIAPEAVASLRGIAPRLFIIKSLVVAADNLRELLKTATLMADSVDAYITDTYDPATNRSGATGKAHDWSVSHMLANLAPKPVILAGGLNVGNVADAIRVVRPAGVDAHTGVEAASGRKDPHLLREFVRTSVQALSAR